MAKSTYSTTPRSILDDPRFMALTGDESHAMLRLYIACDAHGRMPALPAILARRTGLFLSDWTATLTALGSLVDVYTVDGQAYVQIADYDDGLTAGMIRARGESAFPAPFAESVGSESAHATESLQSESVLTTESLQTNYTGRAHARIGAGPEPEPEPYTHIAGAPEPGTMAATLARGIAAGDAMAATPAPDPLPGDLEALASALLDRVATLRHEHGKFAEVGRDLSKTRALVEVDTGPDVRAMAREYPDACREILPRALEAGDAFKLGKGLRRPNCLAYLSAAVTGWVAGEARPVARNGYRERDRTPTWTKGPDMPDAPAHMRAIAE